MIVRKHFREHGRLILRAELRSAGACTISYAVDLTPGSAFVPAIVALEIDSIVELRLSFPKLLDQVELSARVAGHVAPSGPGAPGGVRLEFAPHPRLTALLEASATSASVLRHFRVLLVEDNGFIREVFEFGLRSFFDASDAHIVDHAETVAVAWQRLCATDYDLVIVDYYLPAQNGDVLIGLARGDARFAALPIVAVSVGGRDARDATIAAGADLFLDKPLVFRDLFITLRALSELGAARATAKKTILVFDDSPMILEITRAALEAAGFVVAVADDLATFEHHCGSLRPDLILVDVQMPEVFGDDIVLTLREGRGARVPMLLVSNLEESELAIRAQRANAAGYIHKNAGLNELVRRCREALEEPA